MDLRGPTFKGRKGSGREGKAGDGRGGEGTTPFSEFLNTPLNLGFNETGQAVLENIDTVRRISFILST